jgi:hypothetical protein
VEKGKRAGGFWPKGHLLPPSPDSEQRGRNEPSGGRPWGEAVVPCMATPEGQGKMKRRPRRFDSRAHLGSWRSVEAALRAAADWGWRRSGRRRSGVQVGGGLGRGGAGELGSGRGYL